EMVCNQDWVGADAQIARVGDTAGNSTTRRIAIVDGVPLLRFDETDKSGGYQATVKTDPPSTVDFAVQSNPAESNLEDLTTGQVNSLSLVAHVVHWTPESKLDSQNSAQGPAGTEIWRILALVAIVAAVAEMLMAGIFSASK
ncbi:MAG TPA: hypothetical protein VG733_17810, partial [Chthoniobacteraceae bacterium]|nr:hypothetical protein [Chthoniobacteraceae bacterium]